MNILATRPYRSITWSQKCVCKKLVVHSFGVHANHLPHSPILYVNICLYVFWHIAVLRCAYPCVVGVSFFAVFLILLQFVFFSLAFLYELLLLLRLFRFLHSSMLCFRCLFFFNGYFAVLFVCDYIPGIFFYTFTVVLYNFIV